EACVRRSPLPSTADGVATGPEVPKASVQRLPSLSDALAGAAVMSKPVIAALKTAARTTILLETEPIVVTPQDGEPSVHEETLEAGFFGLFAPRGRLVSGSRLMFRRNAGDETKRASDVAALGRE